MNLINKKNKYIVVSGGGTGGHLSVASELMDEIVKQTKDKIIFIGSQNGADKKWFKNNKLIHKSYFLNTKGIVRQGITKTISSTTLMLKAIITCMFILKKYNIQKVISVGGYSSGGASIACVILKKSLFIHEQNSVYGSLNNLLAKYAKEFFCSYGLDKHLPKKAKNKINLSDIKNYPVRDIFFKHQKAKNDNQNNKQNDNQNNKQIKTIIFMGGSLGAVDINNFALKIAKKLNEKNIKIIHQSGQNDFKKIQKFYKQHNINADCFAYSNNIVKKMSKADMAVSRAGASSLWEFCALGVPCLFIPYPYAYKNHQYQNAKFLANLGLCLLKTKEQIINNEHKIFKLMLKLDTNKISKQLQKVIQPNGAKDIIKRVLSY